MHSWVLEVVSDRLPPRIIEKFSKEGSTGSFSGEVSAILSQAVEDGLEIVHLSLGLKKMPTSRHVDGTNQGDDGFTKFFSCVFLASTTDSGARLLLKSSS